MGYEALTGRLPDYVQLHFLDSGLVGRAEVDPKRLAKAREKIATAAAGMRAARLHAQAGPDDLHLLPVPGDLPVQRRHVTRSRCWIPRRSGRSRSTSATRSCPVGRDGLRAVVELTGRAVVDRLGPFDFDEYLRIWAEERDRQFREDVPQFRETDLAERFVRVLARLRGMAPPPADVTLGPGGRRAPLDA